MALAREYSRAWQENVLPITLDDLIIWFFP